MHTANFCHTAPDGVPQCDLCHHYCRIRPGQCGLCRARQNLDGRLVALTYGMVLSQSAIPIEYQRLHHFMPGTHTWSFGTSGNNFTCSDEQPCQESQPLPDARPTPFTPPDAIVRAALQAECASITCANTEPTISAEYALDVMKLARIADLKTIWVSNGYLSPLCLDKISPWLDAISIELKSIDDAFYRRTCGARLSPILGNLKKIYKIGIHLEITTTIIAGQTDNPNMLRRMADFIVRELGSDLPWHLVSSAPTISQHLAILQTAQLIGKEAGLLHVSAETTAKQSETERKQAFQ